MGTKAFVFEIFMYKYFNMDLKKDLQLGSGMKDGTNILPGIFKLY